MIIIIIIIIIRKAPITNKNTGTTQNMVELKPLKLTLQLTFTYSHSR